MAGSDAERRAAGHLADRLRALGRDADVEPISVWPNWALTHLIHALLAVIGSVVSVGSPLVGFLLLAFTTLSALGDVTGTLYLVRRITGRRASQNVLSAEGGDKPGVLVVVAHYDAARGGSIFDRRIAERRAAVARRLRLPIGIGGGFLLAMAVTLLCAALRLIGFDSLVVSIVQFVPTVLLIVSIPLLADIQLSPPAPGAADNGAGVATALRLAERHGGALEHFDLWVLLTGAEETMALGMREWLGRHRAELSADRTVFLNIDKVGTGTVRYATKEGLVLGARNDPGLIDLCEEIAAEDEKEGRFGARSVVARAPSDALVARARGYRTITISCLGALDYDPNQHQPTDTPDRVDRQALDRTFEFSSILVELIDERLGPELEA